MDLRANVDTISGVGPSVASKLSLLGVKTIGDLIEYYPRRYDDYSQISLIKSIIPGNVVTISGVIKQVAGRYVGRGMHITEAVASDESGSMRLVWFNQPYRAGSIKPGHSYFISGNFELSRGRLTIMNPAIELTSRFPLNTARIVPIYKETKGLKSASIRKAVASLRTGIEQLPEVLPKSVFGSNNMLSHADAILAMHFPSDMESLSKAKERLGFEELFGITLASLLNKQQFAEASGVTVPFDEKVARDFSTHLPFSLTDAQRRVIWQIYKDLQASSPMNRLVEGDVGSGKTVVAAMTAVMALKAGFQVAFMAPTELLARQHAESLSLLFGHTSFKDSIGLLIGSLKPAQKRTIHEKVKSGDIKLVVGTHALITDTVDLHNLGLVIIDEQHRFGVKQRKKLQSKAGAMPHVLSMTATPIPRTLALTLYGELEVSILDEMPPGRIPVITKLVSPNSKKQMYEKVEVELEAGRQVFVVCPLIEESESVSALSAEKVYESLSKSIFKHRSLGLLHGKMKPADKETIMARFVSGELDILVSTTVVEVGVDIPNASVMIVEGVERFGLAQVHQLRGRIGRGSDQGFCYLVMSDSKAPSRRLRALEGTSDGFKLAELDLEIRGPGAIYGHVQSGELDLRVANLSDSKLIARARNSAREFLEQKIDLKKYPELANRVQIYRSITNLN